MDNDPTIKLPPRMSDGLKSSENSREDTSPTDSVPLQGLPESGQPALEYEYSWDRSAVHTPVASESSSPIPPVLSPPPSGKTGRRWPGRRRVLVTIFLLLLLLGGGTLAFGYYYFQTNIQKPLANLIRPVSRSKDEPSGNAIPSDSNVTGRAWNILLLGSDNDGKYSFPAVLTQVMIVVHVDTINNRVTMLSIPRDSWVNVPEVGGMHKIDQAFFLGAVQRDSFDDGVRLARLTIEKDYGITIDRYAWVGLNGFAKVIDTLAGLDIDVTHPIVDDTYPDDTGANANNPNDYKRLYIAPGPQLLNGPEALEYVRSRHADLVGDIGRTQRQQQVLAALRQKLNVASVLGHLQQLMADLQGEVYTDLSEQEMLGFASFGHSLPGNGIARITLGPGSGSQDYGDYGNVYDPAAGGNQDVVVPHCENIQSLINQIFGLGDAQSCNVNG